MTANAVLAAATLGHLHGLGVREYVVCAGARNAPLVGSLLASAEEKSLRLWHHFDERAAAFFALGRTQVTGRPVAVVTTSGTAAAELLPAAVESHYTATPLVLVTADRPVSFRGSGAPQAIEQAGLFGSYAFGIDVVQETDLSQVVKWRENGPLHLNVCFEEPKAEDRVMDWASIDFPPVAIEPPESTAGLLGFLAASERLLVILGDLPRDWADPVRVFLLRLGAPFWAEATSGLREDSSLEPLRLPSERDVVRFDADAVLRIGGVPSLRFWRDVEERSDLEVFSLSHRHFSGLARESRLLTVVEFPDLAVLLEERPDLVVTEPCQVGDQTLLNRLFDEFPGSEPALFRRLSEVIPEEALVFLGNSLPIREWNLAASLTKPHPSCFANRGANGIDGEVATFLGLSEGKGGNQSPVARAARPYLPHRVGTDGRGEGESWAILGDLTALYDGNALAFLPQLSSRRLRVVVINNGGGRIFSRLASMSSFSEDDKRVTENRHDRRFAAWAAMWDFDHVEWRADEPFPELPDGPVIVEVLPDDGDTERFWKEWR